MKPQYSRALTYGRLVNPARRKNAERHKPVKQRQPEDKIILIAAMCAGYLRGEMKSCVRLAL